VCVYVVVLLVAAVVVLLLLLVMVVVVVVVVVVAAVVCVCVGGQTWSHLKALGEPPLSSSPSGSPTLADVLRRRDFFLPLFTDVVMTAAVAVVASAAQLDWCAG
jgi:hypothetical protein